MNRTKRTCVCMHVDVGLPVCLFPSVCWSVCLWVYAFQTVWVSECVCVCVCASVISKKSTWEVCNPQPTTKVRSRARITFRFQITWLLKSTIQLSAILLTWKSGKSSLFASFWLVKQLKLICAFVLSSLNFYNFLLPGCPLHSRQQSSELCSKTGFQNTQM